MWYYSPPSKVLARYRGNAFSLLMQTKDSCYYHRPYLTPLWYFSSPCTSHTDSSNPAEAYTKRVCTWPLHPLFAWNSEPRVCVSSHHSSCSYDGTASRETSPATLPQVPHQSHSITSSDYLLHWLITLLLRRLLALCRAAALEDKLREEKIQQTCLPALLQYRAHNTHLINICWTDKPKV